MSEISPDQDEQVIADAAEQARIFREEWGWAPEVALFMGSLVAHVNFERKNDLPPSLLFDDKANAEVFAIASNALKVTRD